MSISELTSKRAVLDALEEFDRLGREAFLAKYRYGKARRYFIIHDDRQYDSKAVVGVAYGFQFPARGPLKHTDFSGGDRTVKARLEALDFEVRVLSP